jgi:hypothetical protein
MKKPTQSLDQRIDALLEAQPLQPGADFSERMLEAAQAAADHDRPVTRRPLSFVPWALAAAAAVALCASLLFLWEPGTQVSGNNLALDTLDSPESAEILRLEASVSTFADAEFTDFASDDLLATLDALSFAMP